MKFTHGEKLILVMLADLQKALKVRGEVDPDFVKGAIFNNMAWGLEWEHSTLFSDEEVPQTVIEEVVSILDMWSFIESAYSALSETEKKKIEGAVPYFGEGVKFPGFDGNNETEHFATAKFLVEDMHRWSEFNGRELNSHSRSIDGYRNMLRVFGPMRPSLGMGTMTADQIIAILNARHS